MCSSTHTWNTPTRKLGLPIMLAALGPSIENVSYHCVEKGNHKHYGNDTILIQIVDGAMEFPLPKKEFLSVHQFVFSDIEDDHPYVDDIGMTETIAASIASILKSSLDNDLNIVIHCVAGICRSGAVVEAGVQLGFADPGTYRNPNTRVKRMLLQALGLGINQETSAFNMH